MILLPANFFHIRWLYLDRRESDAYSQKLYNHITEFAISQPIFLLPRIF